MLGFQFSFEVEIILGIASLLKYAYCILRIGFRDAHIKELISIHSTEVAVRCIRIISFVLDCDPIFKYGQFFN